MKKRMIALIAMIMLSSTLMYPNVLGQEARYGGTWVASVNNPLATLNPLLTTDSATTLVTRQIFNKLVDIDSANNFVPDLAHSWDISSDGLTYTFYLNTGVKWHDGEEFTSEDVKFTFDLYKEYDLVQSGNYMDIDYIETPDDYTVIIHMSQPFGPFMITTITDFDGGHIIPKHLYEGTDLLTNPHNMDPVGTGPFKFYNLEEGVQTTVIRNDNYFKEGLPYLDKIVFLTTQNPAAMAAAFESGEVDVILMPGLSEAEIIRLSELPGNKLVIGGGSDGEMDLISINCAREPFNDVRVRQAMAYAIDRPLIQELTGGLSTKPTYGPLASTVWGYNPDIFMYPYDLDKANEILDDAGYTRGSDGMRFSVEFVRSAGNLGREMLGAVLKESFAEIGIDLIDVASEGGVIAQRFLVDHDWDLFPWGKCTGPDPQQVWTNFHSTQTFDWGMNPGSYNNARVDELLDLARNEGDPDVRKALYYEFQDIVIDEVPSIPLIEHRGRMLFSTDFQGYPRPTGVGTGNFEQVWWIHGDSKTTLALSGTVADLSSEVADIASEVAGMTGELTDIAGGLTAITGGMTDITGGMTEITGEMTEITGEVAGISSEVTTLDQRMGNLQTLLYVAILVSIISAVLPFVIKKS